MTNTRQRIRRAWVHRHCSADRLPAWSMDMGRHNWEWCEMFGRVAQERQRAAAAAPPRRAWRYLRRNAWFPAFVLLLLLLAHLFKVKFW